MRILERNWRGVQSHVVETERSGGASPKFAASSVGGLASGGAAPDPEVTDKPKRRRFTVEYKLSLLKKADAYRHQPGKVGALLRREGVYSSIGASFAIFTVYFNRAAFWHRTGCIGTTRNDSWSRSEMSPRSSTR